jgi:hypothetical protein
MKLNCASGIELVSRDLDARETGSDFFNNLRSELILRDN